MANAWEQVDWIAAEAVNYLRDALVVTQLTAKDKTADFNVKPNGYSVGSTVDIKSNPVYEAKEFTSAIELQDVRSSKRQMTIEKHFDVSVAMTAKEKRLDLASFSEEIIMPAAYSLAEKSDIYVAGKILEGAGLYASDTLFATAADMALAKKDATFQQLSVTGRFALVNDDLEAALLGADYFNTYNNRGTTGERVFNEGSMGRAMGMEFFSSINYPTTAFTAGDGTTTTDNTVATDNLVGNTTLVVDSTTGTFEAGDRIRIAGVRRPLKVASQVVATGTSIPLVDPIAEIIPDGAAVTVVGSGQALTFKGAIMDDSAMAWASPALDPASDKPTAVVSDSGYSIRVVQGYDMTAKTETISLDMLCGATAYDPRRITVLAEY